MYKNTCRFCSSLKMGSLANCRRNISWSLTVCWNVARYFLQRNICLVSPLTVLRKYTLYEGENKAIFMLLCDVTYTVKPVLSGHSKLDKRNVLKTDGRLMKVRSIAECSFGALCNTFDLH